MSVKRTLLWKLGLPVLAVVAGTTAWAVLSPDWNSTPAAAPTNLSWDFEFAAGRSVVPKRTFDAPWHHVAATDLSKTGHKNESNGCVVWPETGPLGPNVDSSHGDRQATVALIESITQRELPPQQLDDYAFRREGRDGTVDALITSDDESHSALIARAFASINVGLTLRVECPNADALEQTIRTAIPENYSVATSIQAS